MSPPSMPTLHVCPLSRLPETVAASGAGHLVTLINAGIAVERPEAIAPDRHLTIAVSDIAAPTVGHVLAEEAHVRTLIDFAADWDRAAPMVIHCYAGIGRSTAAAYIVTCALAPERDEAEVARALRAASPSASPNPRLVAVADAFLGRDGRMIAAISGIGRGADAFEGTPFRLTVG